MPHNARLHACLRASLPTAAAPGATGLNRLDIGSRRDSYFYVPQSYQQANSAPLVLLLHGAGGHAHAGLDLLLHLADDNGIILVAPASTESSWDVIVKRTYGRDLILVDNALAYMFSHYAVDSTRLAIGGFSDGASYALSLGLENGDLFSHVIAFSPGFIAPLVPRGKPKIFLSHGQQDNVLPIDPCGRRIARQLESAEYAVRFKEFDGGHTIPADIALAAVRWFLHQDDGPPENHSLAPRPAPPG